MTLILPVQECLNQQPWCQAGDFSVFQAYEMPLNDPLRRSQGMRRSLNLYPGLNILIDQYTLQEDLLVDTRVPRSSFNLEFSFAISGNNTFEAVGSGENFVWAGWDTGGLVEWKANQQILKLDIHIQFSLFESLIINQIEQLPPALKQTISHKQQNYFQLDVTTAAMQGALHQFLHCPYQGLTRQVYLQSKALELISLRLNQAIAQTQETHPKRALKLDDIERIHQAKEILARHLDCPPSLLDLARQVGLNDYKLKIGFRQVFQTTAFGYLHAHRMEQARQFLEQRQLSVKEVGQKVGYADARRFAIAFKKQFGVSPQAYRLGNRR